MEVVPKTLEYYYAVDGRCPFKEWLNSIRSMSIRIRIDTRLDRVSLGLMGQCNSVGKGVHELKFDIGPGYRIYFGNQNAQTIVLLLGGDKSSQRQDILNAHTYWEDHLRRLNP